MGAQTPRRPEAHSDSVLRIERTRERRFRRRQKRQRCADQSNYSCSNQAGPGGGTGISAARGAHADDETAGDDAGDPCRVVVVLGSGNMCLHRTRQIQIHAEHVGVIEAEANSPWITGGIAVKKGVRHAGKEAVNRRTVGIIDDDRLTVDKTLQTGPCGIGQRRGSRVVGQGLPLSAEYQTEVEQKNRKLFHDLR